MERFNLRKLEVRKEYQIKISRRSVALKNLNDSKDINRAWESNEDNIKISAKDSVDLNRSSKNHGLMKNFYDFYIKGSRQKHSGYRIQTKAMYII